MLPKSKNSTIIEKITYGILQNFFSGENVRLVATLTINQNSVDVWGADGLDLSRIEMALQFNQDPKALRQV